MLTGSAYASNSNILGVKSDISISASADAASGYGFGKITSSTVGYSYRSGKMVKKGNVTAGGCRVSTSKKTVNNVSYTLVKVLEKCGVKNKTEIEYHYVSYWVKTSLVTSYTVDKVRTNIANQAIKYATTKYTTEKYVYSGETFTSSTLKSDCSGLTKQCYRLAGYPLEHTAAEQAEEGTIIYNNLKYVKTVDGFKYYKRKNADKFTNYSSLKLGDLIIYHEGSLTDVHPVKHIGVYIGKYNGKHCMAHFTSRPNYTDTDTTPCRIESLAAFQKKFPISRVVRIVN